jgi:uncharacterized membrane protein
MTLLYIGSLLFGGSHLFAILFPGLRDSFRAQLGEKAWKALYGLVSLAGVVLMVVGFGRARGEPDMVYDGLAGMKHLTMLLVLLAFILLGASHGKGYLKKWLHNPMSLAIVLWSGGHLLINGRRSDVWLFGTFLVVGLADIVMSEIRGKRPDYIPRVRSDILAVVIGVVLYAVFLFGFHPYVLGIPVV